MLAYIRQRFYWPEYSSDVTLWLSSCAQCQHRRNSQPSRAPLQPYRVGAPFQRVCCDWIGPLKEAASGARYMITLVDQFTKWPEVIPVRDVTAKTVASALLYNVFVRFGIPDEILTDRHPTFAGELFREVMAVLGTRATRILPLRHQANSVERYNRTLREHLTLTVDREQTNWDTAAQIFMMGYRALPHATTGISPCMLMLGRDTITSRFTVWNSFSCDRTKEFRPLCPRITRHSCQAT